MNWDLFRRRYPVYPGQSVWCMPWSPETPGRSKPPAQSEWTSFSSNMWCMHPAIFTTISHRWLRRVSQTNHAHLFLENSFALEERVNHDHRENVDNPATGWLACSAKVLMISQQKYLKDVRIDTVHQARHYAAFLLLIWIIYSVFLFVETFCSIWRRMICITK